MGELLILVPLNVRGKTSKKLFLCTSTKRGKTSVNGTCLKPSYSILVDFRCLVSSVQFLHFKLTSYLTRWISMRFFTVQKSGIAFIKELWTSFTYRNEFFSQKFTTITLVYLIPVYLNFTSKVPDTNSALCVLPCGFLSFWLSWISILHQTFLALAAPSTFSLKIPFVRLLFI